ncbi:hypothetical protein QB607_003291 [Clostridium botulinum]|nr:hypothetical protein [Clostridium botulinum]EKS4395963.1 hypothetical protein [Clostridium botulinum]
MKSMLPRYIINLEEANLRVIFLKVIQQKLAEKMPNLNKEKIESILKDLLDMLPQQLINFQVVIDDVVDFIMFKLNGTQKIKSIMIDVPPLKNNIIQKEIEFNRESFLTGILATQSGWKKTDRFTVKLNNETLLDNIYLKEVGQFNYLNGVCKVKNGDKIIILYNNQEGNSKQFIMDFEYLTL